MTWITFLFSQLILIPIAILSRRWMGLTVLVLFRGLFAAFVAGTLLIAAGHALQACLATMVSPPPGQAIGVLDLLRNLQYEYIDNHQLHRTMAISAGNVGALFAVASLPFTLSRRRRIVAASGLFAFAQSLLDVGSFWINGQPIEMGALLFAVTCNILGAPIVGIAVVFVFDLSTTTMFQPFRRAYMWPIIRVGAAATAVAIVLYAVFLYRIPMSTRIALNDVERAHLELRTATQFQLPKGSPLTFHNDGFRVSKLTIRADSEANLLLGTPIHRDQSLANAKTLYDVPHRTISSQQLEGRELCMQHVGWFGATLLGDEPERPSFRVITQGPVSLSWEGESSNSLEHLKESQYNITVIGDMTILTSETAGLSLLVNRRSEGRIHDMRRWAEPFGPLNAALSSSSPRSQVWIGSDQNVILPSETSQGVWTTGSLPSWWTGGYIWDGEWMIAVVRSSRHDDKFAIGWSGQVRTVSVARNLLRESGFLGTVVSLDCNVGGGSVRVGYETPVSLARGDRIEIHATNGDDFIEYLDDGSLVFTGECEFLRVNGTPYPNTPWGSLSEGMRLWVLGGLGGLFLWSPKLLRAWKRTSNKRKKCSNAVMEWLRGH